MVWPFNRNTVKRVLLDVVPSSGDVKCFKMADEVGADPQQSYDDPDIATIVADDNWDELVKSLDPLYFVLVLVSRDLISKQQARDILNNRAKIKTRSERNLAFLNLVKSSPDPTWFSALLEALEEERTTERLKEVLEKSE